MPPAQHHDTRHVGLAKGQRVRDSWYGTCSLFTGVPRPGTGSGAVSRFKTRNGISRSLDPAHSCRTPLAETESRPAQPEVTIGVTQAAVSHGCRAAGVCWPRNVSIVEHRTDEAHGRAPLPRPGRLSFTLEPAACNSRPFVD